MNTSHLREQLAHQVAGEVLDGADPAAAAETAGFNTSITHRPAVVVTARSAADVAAAVRAAGDAGLKVTVQATGHGAAASAEGTVFVSTKAMRALQVDPATRVARVEAGVRWRQVIDAAAPHGLAPLSGSSSGVGVVGYTLGGGMGHLARRHGFAADRVRAIELVTAAGEVTTVTAQSDSDLFWALRGGQGSFGIVTALEFDLVPVPHFYGGALFFTGADIEPVLRAFGAWAPTLPEEVTTSVALLRLPPSDDVPPPLRGTVSLALRFGFAGAPAEGAALLAPMRAVATPVLDSIGPMSYAEVDRIHMDPTEPMPAVTRGTLLTGLPADLLDALLAVAGPGVDVPLALVELRLMGGALARPTTIPNAVAGRDGAFALTVVAPAPPPLAAVAPVVTSQVVEAVAPWTTGSSLVNFGGHGSPDSPWAPEVLDRLRRVKAAADPGDIFGGVVSASALAEVGAR
jgi:hypothetical protein